MAVHSTTLPPLCLEESSLQIWKRRLVTIPALFLAGLLLLAVYPALALIAVTVDLIRRRRWATLRFLTFVVYYLLLEMIVLCTCLVLWVAARAWTRLGRARLTRWNYGLQRVWANTLYAGAEVIFGFRTIASGLDCLRPGPYCVFIRHVSFGDTLVPLKFLAGVMRLSTRHVLKREQLLDPGFDFVGNRMPNYFVRRGSENKEQEIDNIVRLSKGMTEEDALVIWPEGTRFTEAKRERILQRFERLGEEDLLVRARGMKNVLLPRPGGPLALLQQDEPLDVVFCAHVGFEGTRSFGDVLNGAMIGRTVKVAFWRTAAREIPKQREALSNWLFEQWGRIDQWIQEHQPRRAP